MIHDTFRQSPERHWSFDFVGRSKNKPTVGQNDAGASGCIPFHVREELKRMN